MKDHGNYDYSHRHEYGPNKQIPYSSLDRKHYSKTRWCGDRKQNTSSRARRRYISTANKHTRQLLRQEMIKELNDGCISD